MYVEDGKVNKEMRQGESFFVLELHKTQYFICWHLKATIRKEK